MNVFFNLISGHLRIRLTSDWLISFVIKQISKNKFVQFSTMSFAYGLNIGETLDHGFTEIPVEIDLDDLSQLPA